MSLSPVLLFRAFRARLGAVLAAALLAVLAAGCNNSGGGNALPAITAFTANQQPDQVTITAGDAATLAFTFTNGAGSLDQNLGPVNSGGSLAVTPSATTTYLLTVVGAGATKVFKAVTVKVAPAPAVSEVLAPASAGVNQSGLLALVQPQPGCSYLWNLTGNGAINGSNTENVVRFTAAGAGSIDLQCTVSNAAGKAAPPVKATVTVQATTFITDFRPDPASGSKPGTLTAGESIALLCGFTGAKGRIDPEGTPVTSGVPFTDSPTQTRRYTLTVFDGSTVLDQREIWVEVLPALVPSPIAAPPQIFPNLTYRASVPVQAGGATYAWTVTGGTLNAGADTPEITFKAAAAGSVQLDCTVANGAGKSLKAATVTLPIQPAPGPVAVNLPAGISVPANKAGIIAAVDPVPGAAAYQWSASTGTVITSGADSPAITFTAPDRVASLAPVTCTLTCTATLADGSKSAGSIDVAVTKPYISRFVPDRPFITAGDAIVTSEFIGAAGGIITPGGTPVVPGATITVLPGAYTLTVTDSAGNIDQQVTNVTQVPAAAITGFSALQPIVGPLGTTQLVAAFSGETGVIDNGVGAIPGDGTPVAIPALATGTTFTLTVRNKAGDPVSRQVEVRVATVSVLAGLPAGPGNVDGASAVARFSAPGGAAMDAVGNLFVADTDNNRIRKVAPDGSVSTLAGSGVAGFADETGSLATFNAPEGVAVGPDGNIYIADTGNHAVRVVTPAGVVTTLAGQGPAAPGDEDGRGAGPVRFNGPRGVAVTSTGHVVVADTGNFRIRVILVIAGGGIVADTLGGTAAPGTLDGNLGVSRFQEPSGIVCDADDNLLITDTSASTIRKLYRNGASYTVATVAGLAGAVGFVEGPGAAARFGSPTGITFWNNAAYVTDDTHHVIRRLAYVPAPPGPPAPGEFVVDTLAGDPANPTATGTVDGAPAVARFTNPRGLAANPAGIHVVDKDASNIRRIDFAGDTETYAGPRYGKGVTDGVLAAARFNGPVGMTMDAAHNLYLADSKNHTIRRVNLTTGVVDTLAGQAGLPGATDGGPAVSRFRSPNAIVADLVGNLFVADSGNHTIRRIDVATGAVTTLAGGPGGAAGAFADGAGGVARFNQPTGLARIVDGGGNLVTLYVADLFNNVIRAIDPAGNVVTLAGIAGTAGIWDGPRGMGGLRRPAGLALDPSGNLLVSDAAANNIRKVLLTGTPATVGTLSTVAGNGLATTGGYADGLGTAALFNRPGLVAVDALGNLLVADLVNQALRQVAPTGYVTTAVGIPGQRGIRAGDMPVPLSNPNGIVVDPDPAGRGDIYISTPDAILKVEFR